jgi:hypothetical protein
VPSYRLRFQGKTQVLCARYGKNLRVRLAHKISDDASSMMTREQAMATDTLIRSKDAPPPTDLRALADQTFAVHSPYDGEGFRNHCLRLYELALLVLEQDGVDMYADVAYLMSMTHDLGLVAQNIEGPNYMQRSWQVFKQITEGLELGHSTEELGECMLLNHKVLPLSDAAPSAEAFRKAVWIEHTRGVRSYGLDKAEVRRIFKKHPRDNFDKVMADFFYRTLRHEPHTVLNGIFI